MSNVSMAWTVLATSIAWVITTALIMWSGHNYSVHDTQAHSIDFGRVIREGHGGITVFLWIWYALTIVWTVAYFALHASEFAVLFAY